MRRVAAATLCAMLVLAWATIAPAQGFHAAATKDGIDAWAVGDSGRVWRSLDGGASWVPGVIGAAHWRAVRADAFTVLMAGDSAKVVRSADDGGTWSAAAGLGAVPVSARWRALARASVSRVFVCGDGGRIARSDDDGATWALQGSGASQNLNALVFTDALHGWCAGDAGVLLATSDGGAHWNAAALPTTRALYAVAAHGASVWAGGEAGACFHSTDGGATFAPYDLRAGEMPDVRAMVAYAPGAIAIAGGGGFLRTSTDEGTTWSFIAHPLMASIAALALPPLPSLAHGVAVSELARVPIAGTLGTPWALPAGGTNTLTWSKVGALPTQTTNVRGNTVVFHPRDKRVMYNMLGNTLYRSPDEGEHWNTVRVVTGVARVNQLLICPSDTTVFLAAVVTSGGSRQLQRSSDGGNTWSTTLTHAFGEYGTPLQMHPLRPDTLYFGGESDTLMRSLDFGLTWRYHGTGVFRSPCDLAMLADSAEVIYVADGVTNIGAAILWRSIDGGLTFTAAQTLSASEAPAIATSRLAPGKGVVTSWAGAGARATSDMGATWPLSPDLNRTGQNVSQTWGADFAHDDPGVVWVGTFSSGRVYLSQDGGATYAFSALLGPNYAMIARDRATVFAQQADGLYKLRTLAATPWASSAQALTLTSPNGGETWLPGSQHAITWSATNVALVQVQWRPDAASAWLPIALTDGYRGTYAWTVPARFTSTAEMRVSDAWDAAPLDGSDATFAIHGALAACADTPLDLGVANFPVGGFGTFTIRNAGDLPLHVTQVFTDRSTFHPGRFAFTLAAGATDTLSARFYPLASGADSALFTLTTDDAAGALALRVRASASASVDVTPQRVLADALAPAAPQPVAAGGRTRLRFTLAHAGPVRLEVFGLRGERVAILMDGLRDAGAHEVVFEPSSTLRGGMYFVRLRAGAFTATQRVVVLR
jgi:photosystem II stability/assembly factor-like uncharacterized protein